MAFLSSLSFVFISAAQIFVRIYYIAYVRTPLTTAIHNYTYSYTCTYVHMYVHTSILMYVALACIMLAYNYVFFDAYLHILR